MTGLLSRMVSTPESFFIDQIGIQTLNAFESLNDTFQYIMRLTAMFSSLFTLVFGVWSFKNL